MDSFFIGLALGAVALPDSLGARTLPAVEVRSSLPFVSRHDTLLASVLANLGRHGIGASSGQQHNFHAAIGCVHACTHRSVRTKLNVDHTMNPTDTAVMIVAGTRRSVLDAHTAQHNAPFIAAI